MEGFDPVAEFLVYVSEVNVDLDDARKYLFYSLVTIAIWLIIKVFIEISESRGRPSDSVLSNVDTRRRNSVGSIQTISEIVKKEDGDRRSKAGVRVRFDLTKNEGYVIGDESTNGVVKEADVTALGEKRLDNPENGEGRIEEETEENEVEKVEVVEETNQELPEESKKEENEVEKVEVVEETNRELPEESEKVTDEECAGNSSEETERKGTVPVDVDIIITEVEEDADPESEFTNQIEEVSAEDAKIEGCDGEVEMATHESVVGETEEPVTDGIGDAEGDEETEIATGTSEQNFPEDIERKLVDETSGDFTAAVTKETFAKEIREVEETEANNVQKITDEGVGEAECCERVINCETSTEKIAVKDVDEDVEKITHVLTKEKEESLLNETGYTDSFLEDVHEMGVDEKEKGEEKGAEKTEPIEIDVTQEEVLEDFLNTREDFGVKKIVNEIEKETEGMSQATVDVTGEDNTAINTTTEVPQWYATVELVTNGGKVRDSTVNSTTKSLVKMFESLRESNFERTESVLFKTKRIRRHLSMPFVDRIGSIRYGGHFDKELTLRSEKAGGQESTDNGEVAGDGSRERRSFKGADVESTSLKVSPKEGEEVGTNKVPGCGVRVTRSRSLRDWKEDLKLSYKAGEWRLARGLPLHERFEDPDRERLIHETFGAILRPTFLQREPVPVDVINRSYTVEERNLLKNNCGQNGLKDWISKFRLQDWKVIEDEEETTEFPKDREGKLAVEFDGNLSFFETTARNSRKEQEIDLISEGFSAYFLDKEQPHILVSEWIKVEEHCKSTYELRVKLLDQKKETISEKDILFDVSNKAKWEKVSYVFKGYGPGVRYVLFNHGAVKWSGTNGCRMTGAVVRVLNPT